ncbi:MAG: GNAT family N-acetyltransferase [Spirochaetes bacterium]|nr:GNAT family N-acetyltransferase [Spirochaetota bacterium]MBN2772469.1 GNAT family N-acetyltransferase [Spirochaetota bacterium]
MELKLEKGTEEHIEDCIEALENSSLCVSYFDSYEIRHKAVVEAIESKELYVAIYNGNCAGFGYIIPEGAFHAFHYLHLFAVKDKYRGKGIGRKLLMHIENQVFKERDKLFLVVGDYNPDARKFYENNGYTFIGTIPGLYREGIDEHLMMKKKH